ncbi:MAG: 50S ribosomal protein L25/general stress protein Ctc [Pseudoclavibacter sp.]
MASNDKHTLTVDVRTEFGKGAARRLRAANKIPAVVYGHGEAPRHIALPGHETMLIIRQSNAIIDLQIEGESQLALVKDVQRDPVLRIIEHMDLVVVRFGERVEVEVSVHLVGEPFAGTIAFQETNTVLVSAEATHIPDSFDVSVEGLEEGAVVHATDLVLPEGVNLVDEESDIIIATVSVPRGETESDDAAAAEAAEGETAEGDE